MHFRVRSLFVLILADILLSGCTGDPGGPSFASDETAGAATDGSSTGETGSESGESSVVIHNDELTVANFVEEIDAVHLAENFGARGFSSRSGTASNGRRVGRVQVVPGDSGEAAYYIVNYAEGGFVIVAADRRVHPILAYADEGSFQVDAVDAGLSDWLHTTVRGVDEVRGHASAAAHPRIWDHMLGGGTMMQRMSDGEGQQSRACEDDVETVGPLIKSKWDQGCGSSKSVRHAIPVASTAEVGSASIRASWNAAATTSRHSVSASSTRSQSARNWAAKHSSAWSAALAMPALAPTEKNLGARARPAEAP